MAKIKPNKRLVEKLIEFLWQSIDVYTSPFKMFRKLVEIKNVYS